MDNSNVLLVTANVGTLFEDPLNLMQQWIHEFVLTIKQLQPQFIALHMQEVGGKTYEQSSNHVKEFIESLCGAYEMQEFTIARIYLDENFNSQDQFTALGNIYFAHKTIQNIRLWNFTSSSWESTQGKLSYYGNIEDVPTKEKSKFPREFFPECKWSRKGFMRTRWDINGTIVDFVNIHLFHDASNLTALADFPSVYSQRRRKALIHTLKRFDIDKDNEIVPYFLFGDFNFRSDSVGVTKELTKNLSLHRLMTLNANNLKKQYRDEFGETILIIGKKEFHHIDHQNKFREKWLKKYDRDLEIFKDILFEHDISFPPSYPYEEKSDLPTKYLTTRCPSWCDRVLMSPQMNEITLCKRNSYNLIGNDMCMGDHKPVYLNIQIKPNQGIVKPAEMVRKCLHHISNNLLSNAGDISNHPVISKPSNQFIKLQKTYNIACQNILDSGLTASNMNEYLGTHSWMNSIGSHGFTIMRETFL
ncbi:inositol polyphosphate-5-phosphatase A isoform X1 [Zeugodacus cucurbitae]|uniref:inositol-polyphosphate 5-phosphatase n=2 Tax=Zeugodacus cucurbitae TaxID=28588 RepID=A0A0A1X946_ZEUCU|nr:inositol polyphosphate-5-phosphatase A isoform X1 [Zeugodacus cucurbitae]